MRSDLRSLCAEVFDLKTLETAITALADSVGANARFLPTYGKPNRGGPFFELNGRQFIYFQEDHGKITQRLATTDPGEAIFAAMYDVTWETASDLEQENRLPRRDYRRLFYQYHRELLRQLDSSLEQIREREIDDELRERPFDDLSWERFQMTGELAKDGMPWKEAETRALEIFPEPSKADS